MLPILLNTPKTPQEWNEYTFHHRTSHELIIQAIMAKNGVILPIYPIDPFPPTAPIQWLESNQQYHTDMNGILGLPGSDLEDVNLTEERQLQPWTYLHFLEHQTAENFLGISS
jgi:hypothetical protein